MQLPVRKESLPMAGALLAAALAGGTVAVIGAALVGTGEHTTTIRELVPTPTNPPGNVSQTSQDRPLTVRAIYDRDAPGVVQVTTTTKVKLPQTDWFGNPFGPPGTEVQRSLGSGFVIDKAGYIVTNYHVVGNAQSVHVSFSNNDSMKAEVIGKDPATDVALLKVQASSRALKPLSLGDSDGDSRRRPGSRHREPARPRPQHHARDRQRAPPLADLSGGHAHRSCHPDRRGAQPRQLGRPAAERAGPGRRRQLCDLDRRLGRGKHRNRFRNSHQHSARRRRRAEGSGPRRPPVPRRRHAARVDDDGSDLQPAGPEGAARRERGRRKWRRSGGSARRHRSGCGRRRELPARRRRDHEGGRHGRSPRWSACARSSRSTSPATRCPSCSTAALSR